MNGARQRGGYEPDDANNSRDIFSAAEREITRRTIGESGAHRIEKR